MNKGFEELDLAVARARIVLSVLAMGSLYVDPTVSGGAFRLTGYTLVAVLCHLGYSVSFYFGMNRAGGARTLAGVSFALDLVFATVIALVTEGANSPSYIFFIFAIVAVGVRGPLWPTMMMTLGSVILYLATIAISDGLSGAYAMRAVYLAIAGYLISFFGQLRSGFEARVRELESRAERHAIARSLHDGYVQALAGVNLRLQTCRELITRDQPGDALTELTELQTGVAREYDRTRAWIRELAGVDAAPGETPASAADPSLKMEVSLIAAASVGEHLLQIALEGIRNARKHAAASTVAVAINGSGGKLSMTIDDDGAGFSESDRAPWAIASRVAELGGRLTLNGSGSARMKIEVPAR
jgi:signal transduction histidine kinase